MEKNFLVITYNQEKDTCESKDFSNLQESASYFQTFETSAEPNAIPVCIYNLQSKAILDISDFYINDNETLQRILQNCLAK